MIYLVVIQVGYSTALPPPPKKSTSEALSSWSEGHVWVSPEMHGAITGTFKNQIDWLLDIN